MMGSVLLLSQILCLLIHSHFQPSHSSSNFSSLEQLCPGDQSLALLEFKSSFSMMSSYPWREECNQPKTVLWRKGTDCCSWDGVTCNMKTGHVIGLDLRCSMLHGTLHSSSTLFFLHHLQKLDLSHNDFNRSVISSSFGQLLHLTHLNLNSSNFAGQVPPEISHLSRLASLDLSYNILMLEAISFNKLAQNLTQLRELYLTGVNMSLVAPSSFMNLSSSLTSLQLRDCGLQGELPDYVFLRSNLQSLSLTRNEELTGSFPPYNVSNALSYLDLSWTLISIHLEPDSISHLKSVEMMFLDGCNFAGSNLGLLGNLTRLRELGLAFNHLGGEFPFSLGKLKHLEYLDLGYNDFIGPMPDDFANHTRLVLLDLSFNSFTGQIQNEFSNLTQLILLDLSSNKFDGKILSSLENLEKLVVLNLSFNNFTGEIPNSLFNLTQLTELSLSYNKFYGQISSSLANLDKLSILTLSSNDFTGEILDLLFNFTQLTWLDLSNNKFDGQISSSLGSLEKLNVIKLSFNNFTGKIPNSLFNLTQLDWLELSNNRLIGPIPSQISKLSSLSTLYLSHNLFDGTIPSSLFSSKLSGLSELLLSDNQLIGPIPSQISRLSSLSTLDLSHNLLDGTIPPSLFSMPSLLLLFLQNNLFNGRISPFLSNSLQYIDFSHNKLYGQIPPSVFKLEKLTALMLSSNNKLTGNISSVIRKLKFLEILDLSNNSFSGFIPQCLGNFSDNLSVLHLGANNFQGNIPSVYSEWNKLTYLNFNGNQLKGVIPPSIINCESLEFLDLGNNMIDDTFPSFLEMLPNLEVIILRSNKLHGSLKGPTANDSFSKLKIFDLSNNSLSGPLPTEYFNNLKAMMSVDQDMDYIMTRNLSTFVYSVTMTWKGLQIEFTKIQSVLTILDLSSNKFTGKIPESLGKLKSLIQLNLSHNNLISYIQPSLGNLTNVESLDLSSNMLTGRIPEQLVDLTFLEVLNLSYNQLEGSIPQGKQFSTFEHGSYEGNLRLCGLPLKVKCNNGEGQQLPPSNFEKEDSMFEEGFGWKAVAMGYGCGFVFGVSMGYVVFRIRKPAWFVKMVERGGHQNTKRLRRKNAPRTGGRRH